MCSSDLVALAGSETVLLDLNNLSTATNHNGGALHFGPDRKLYVAVGDNATGSNSQSLANLLGKILRIGADGSIPTDNPFYATATGVTVNRVSVAIDPYLVVNPGAVTAQIVGGVVHGMNAALYGKQSFVNGVAQHVGQIV